VCYLANHVALPGLGSHEAALASFLGGDRGRAASLAGRVFSDFASFFLVCLASSNAAGQGCPEAPDVVAHADRAGVGAALQGGAGQSGHLLGGTTNHVALPGLRRHEAALALFLGGNRGRAASLGARGVFRDFAAGGLLAGSLAVGQRCFPAFDVVAHADRAGVGTALQGGPGQSGRFLGGNATGQCRTARATPAPG